MKRASIVQEFPKIDKFTINRKEWQRGNGSSVLWDAEAKAGCCLGLYGRACGVPVEALSGITTPRSLLINRGFFLTGLLDPEARDNALTPSLRAVDRVMCANDLPIGHMTYPERHAPDEDEREDKVATFFASIGVEVTFED